MIDRQSSDATHRSNWLKLGLAWKTGWPFAHWSRRGASWLTIGLPSFSPSSRSETETPAVGFEVEAEVAVPDCPGVGSSVGEAVGVSECSEVAPPVAEAVGVSECAGVGSAVGAVVGPSDGLAAGNAEGIPVGIADGTKMSGMGGIHSSIGSEGTPQRQYLLRQHDPERHSSPPKHGVMAEKLG